ncbi:glycosyltransferase family 2 protein [Scytonema sp. PCC 10023]|uniref:glycosyltransferase family 2 protein n=1 Tax=Scytonema sp. PCC 10023 TaxID=1680591 RepID=UPI0039C5F37D
MADTYPTVSIAIPTYNESLHIKQVIRGLLQTNYPNIVEVFIADGGSSDGTQNIVKKLSLEDSRVKLLHNPLKIQAAALNLILKECTGDIFLRADAHSDYAPDYIERCVEALLESKALNVGGAQRFVAKTPFQAGVALASRSILGNGGAKYRDPNYNGYAETVYLGCFWKKALLDISGYSCEVTPNEDAELNLKLRKYVFDTSQITNQDAELNQELLCENLHAIYISSKICVWYYPRKSWKSLWFQYFKYGRGRYLTNTKHSTTFQLRGKLPFLVLSITILMLSLDLLFPLLGLPIEKLVLLGLLLPFLESLRITLKFSKDFSWEIWRSEEDEIPSWLSRWFFCGVALITMPIAHFSGYSYQLLRHRVFRVSGW